MQIDYDTQADAIYIRFRDGDVDDTQTVNKYVYLDVDTEGKPLGLEILFASHILPEDGLTRFTFNIEPQSTDLASIPA